MYDPVSAICQDVRNKNFDSAIQHYSIFFHKLLTALFNDSLLKNKAGQTLIEIINGNTNFHSAIVHFLYFLKYNDKKYITTRNCKDAIQKQDSVDALIECESINKPYIYLPPNFNIYLSKSLDVATNDLRQALGNSEDTVSEDFLFKYSQLFANVLNGYSQCSFLSVHTENIIWLQELHLIALLYRYFHLAYQKREQERKWKNIAARDEIFALQTDYETKYENLQREAMNSVRQSHNNYDVLLEELRKVRDRLTHEQSTNAELNAKLMEKMGNTTIVELSKTVEALQKDIQTSNENTQQQTMIMNNQLEEEKKCCEEKRRELADLALRYENLQDAYDAMTDDVQKLEDEKMKREADAVSVEQLLNEATRLESECNDLRQKEGELEETKKALESCHEALDKAKKDIDEENKKRTECEKEKREEIRTLRDQIERSGTDFAAKEQRSNEEIRRLTADRDELKSKNDELATKVQQLEDDNADLQSDNNTIKRKLDTTKSELGKCHDDLKAKDEEYEKECDKLMSDKSTTNHDLEKAKCELEACRNDLKAKIDELENQLRTNDATAQECLERAERNLATCHEELRARDAELEQTKKRLNECLGKCAESFQEWEAAKEGWLQYKSHCEEIERKLKEKEDRLRECERNLKIKDSEVTNQRSRFDSSRDKKDEELRAVREKLKGQTSEINEMKRKERDLRAEIEDLEAAKSRDLTEKEIELESRHRQQLMTKEKQHETEQDSLRRKVLELETSSKNEAVKYRANAMGLEEKVRDLERKLSNTTLSLGDKERERAKMESVCENLRSNNSKEVSKLKKTINDYETILSTRKRELRDASKNNEKLKEAIKKLTRDSRQRKERERFLNAKISKQDGMLNTAKKNYGTLARQFNKLRTLLKETVKNERLRQDGTEKRHRDNDDGSRRTPVVRKIKREKVDRRVVGATALVVEKDGTEKRRHDNDDGSRRTPVLRKIKVEKVDHEDSNYGRKRDPKTEVIEKPSRLRDTKRGSEKEMFVSSPSNERDAAEQVGAEKASRLESIKREEEASPSPQLLKLDADSEKTSRLESITKQESSPSPQLLNLEAGAEKASLFDSTQKEEASHLSSSPPPVSGKIEAGSEKPSRLESAKKKREASPLSLPPPITESMGKKDVNKRKSEVESEKSKQTKEKKTEEAPLQHHLLLELPVLSRENESECAEKYNIAKEKNPKSLDFADVDKTLETIASLPEPLNLTTNSDYKSKDEDEFTSGSASYQTGAARKRKRDSKLPNPKRIKIEETL